MKLTSLTVMAHGAEEATFQRHVPFWNAACNNISVISPETDPLKDSPFRSLLFGNHGHANRDSCGRIRLALSGIVKHQAGHHLICEYDSFPIAPEFTLLEGLIGPLQPNYEPTRFMASRFPNPPWLLDWKSAAVLLEVARLWPAIWEEGFADRYLAALAMIGNVPILDYDPAGYTRATIERRYWYDMECCIRKGGVMIHGVKDEATLAFALKAYGNRPLESENAKL